MKWTHSGYSWENRQSKQALDKRQAAPGVYQSLHEILYSILVGILGLLSEWMRTGFGYFAVYVWHK